MAFKMKRIFITIDDPDEAEHFLRGLIIARQNNSSEYFTQLIDGVNLIMEPYRLALIEEQKQGSRSRVGVDERYDAHKES
jgi:hypothetical protein